MSTPSLLSVVGLLIASPTFSQTILNGGFETWPPGCPVNTTPNGWANFSTDLGPDQAGSCAGTVISFEGSSHMNLVWSALDDLREGAAQPFLGTAGTIYEVSFHAIHDQGLYASTDPTVLEVSITGTVMLTTPDLISGEPWAPFSFLFTATGSTQVLGFRVAAGSTGTTGCVGVDAVSIAPSTGLASRAENPPVTVLVDQGVLLFHSAVPIDRVELFDGVGRSVAIVIAHGRQLRLELPDRSSGILLYHASLADGRTWTGRVVMDR